MFSSGGVAVTFASLSAGFGGEGVAGTTGPVQTEPHADPGQVKGAEGVAGGAGAVGRHV